MADLGEIRDGPVREWLAARRAELNARFRQARRRYPRLDGERVLALMAELLPPLAGPEQTGSGALFGSVYDLILLHAARERLEAHGGALDLLLRRTFPALRDLLSSRPGPLCAALSNAVENLGPKGFAFARDLPEVGASLRRADELLDAGAVLAWRLGEARLRGAALSAAGALPPRAILAALALDGWPEQTVPLILDALRADAWTAPAERFSAATIEQYPRLSGAQREAVRKRLSEPAATTRWRSAGTVGGFAGFGGDFEEPPLLLAWAANPSRHSYRARAGGSVFRIDADVFGWRCRRDTDADGTVRAVTEQRVRGGQRLHPNGCLESREGAVALPGAEGAVSFHAALELVAFTLRDSFRIRIAVPVREVL